MDPFRRLLDFLERLEAAGLYFTLQYLRENSVLVTVFAPAARWEIDFFDDGNIDVEVFESTGEVVDEEALEQMFAEADDWDSGSAPAAP